MMSIKLHTYIHELQSEHGIAWSRWRQELEALKGFTVRRCYKPQNFLSVKSASLNNFCDASTFGYGVATYFRLVDLLVLCRQELEP